MKRFVLFSAMLLGIVSKGVLASNVIPIGNENNLLYYQIGGGSDFSFPPPMDTDTISLNVTANLGLDYNCDSFNPILSITNSINETISEAKDAGTAIINNATAAIILLPDYQLAKRRPDLYALLHNNLLKAEKKISVSSKNCQGIKDQISHGENPYQEWATIAIGDQWKKKISLGVQDVNQIKRDIDNKQGEDGVTWVSGNKDSNGSFHSGGKGQPPVHVIADTVKAGYNIILNRDFQNSSAAPINDISAFSRVFPTPIAATNWVVSVVGDQMITTCSDNECKQKQGSLVGRGLLPMITSCHQDNVNCIDSIRDHLAKLVTGNEAVTKENLERVSADGIAISSDVITAIHNMDGSQQRIITNKLAQEIAVQRLIDKAIIARELLEIGAQVPVIIANHPAQVIITRAITHLDKDIKSIMFERQTRKQMMPDTLMQILNFSNNQQRRVMNSRPLSSSPPMMESGAISTR